MEERQDVTRHSEAHAHPQANPQSSSQVSLGDVSRSDVSLTAPHVPLLPGDEAAVKAGTREEGPAAAGRLRHVGVWSAGMCVCVRACA